MSFFILKHVIYFLISYVYNPVRTQTYVIKKYEHKRLRNNFTFKFVIHSISVYLV